MKLLKKKELQLSIQEALGNLLNVYSIDKPSRKTIRLIEKSSSEISRKLRDTLRKELKKKTRKHAMASKSASEEMVA